jgi:DNA-directed RNA polymerase subunit RPC12/RpoP
MSIKRIRCPYCVSKRTKKKGKRDGIQRYQCNDCGKKFRSKRNHKRVADTLWDKYTNKKQTLEELVAAYGKSHIWVRKRLDEHTIALPALEPCTTVLVADTTFWGRHYGVMVFRSWTLKKNLWWGEVATEKVAHYHYARKLLEDKGWVFTATVVDGRRGLSNVFKDIPVQVCQFHQLQTVTKYLTRRPKTDAGKELRLLALTLTKTNETTFTKALLDYEQKWKHFLNEQTIILGLNRPQYTHKNVRSALRSLKTNLLNLFTYQRYPELGIPNTTNTIDGYFASVKKKTAAHHGLRRDRRFRVISELLSSSEE